MAPIEGAGARQRFGTDLAGYTTSGWTNSSPGTRRPRGRRGSRKRPSPPGGWLSRLASLDRSRLMSGSRRSESWRSKRPITGYSRRNWRQESRGSRAYDHMVSVWETGSRSARRRHCSTRPDVRTKKGTTRRAMFVTLLGCGLRRSELTNLTMKHVQQRDNR
jgi:hypothetical protein